MSSYNAARASAAVYIPPTPEVVRMYFCMVDRVKCQNLRFLTERAGLMHVRKVHGRTIPRWHYTVTFPNGEVTMTDTRGDLEELKNRFFREKNIGQEIDAASGKLVKSSGNTFYTFATIVDTTSLEPNRSKDLANSENAATIGHNEISNNLLQERAAQKRRNEDVRCRPCQRSKKPRAKNAETTTGKKKTKAMSRTPSFFSRRSVPGFHKDKIVTDSDESAPRKGPDGLRQRSRLCSKPKDNVAKNHKQNDSKALSLNMGEVITAVVDKIFDGPIESNPPQKFIPCSRWLQTRERNAEDPPVEEAPNSDEIQTSGPESNMKSEMDKEDRDDCRSMFSVLSLPPMSYYGGDASSHPADKTGEGMPDLSEYEN